MAEKNYYTILRVSPVASAEEIREAYRQLALRFHPDRSTDPGANRVMQLVNEAYDILKDPAKRAEYDRYLTGMTVIIPSIPPEPPPPEPQPIVPLRPAPRKKRRRAKDPEQLQAEFRLHIVWLVRVILGMIALFLLSLITNQIIWPIFWLLIGLCLWLVVSLVIRIRS